MLFVAHLIFATFAHLIFADGFGARRNAFMRSTSKPMQDISSPIALKSRECCSPVPTMQSCRHPRTAGSRLLFLGETNNKYGEKKLRTSRRRVETGKYLVCLAAVVEEPLRTLLTC